MFKTPNVREAQAKLAALDRVQGVIEFDLTGRILTANQNFLDVVGYTLPEIGVQLNLSRHTIADYVKQIYRKLAVRSRTELARVVTADAAAPPAPGDHAGAAAPPAGADPGASPAQV